MGSEGQVHGGATGPAFRSTRVVTVTRDDPLRTCVERLAVPGVRRLVVVKPDSRVVEGVVSLSDVAAFMFL